MDFFQQKIWSKGCKYIVSNPNELCTKCGQRHNQTAEEAGHALFPTKEKTDVETDD